ncbi:actin-associated protein FAM107A-like [Pleurodeles waltl]|uniref:actin-associated protein FAM107A-like n=1 Tax=Pleurodeles waltl TaxID=8319 RepID=UPI0037096B09
MSQELWLWAKAQVLASLRSPYGLEAILPAPKKASPGTGDRNGESVLPPTTAQLLASCKAANPMKASRTRQDLHKELLLTHRKGLVLHSKPELLRVLERRRCQERLGAEPTQDQTPLQQELLRWQQRREEKEAEKGSTHEFLKVRENLRKCPWREPRASRTSPS